jgi:SEC-C motif-containing protein
MASTPTGLAQPQSGQPCPCGSGRLFDACCAPLLAGQRVAATAEELMRSRFTAHVAKDYRYLHFTYEPTAKTPYVEETDESPVSWTKLVVHSHELGKQPDLAYVDFSAYFTEQGQEGAMHEKSEFRRIDGKWLFMRPVRQGPAPVKAAVKVGRNDPCPCGSGKKYKQCCLAKA